MHPGEPNRPTIAVPVGDPSGIGPEIAIMAATDPGVLACARLLLVSDPSVVETVASRLTFLIHGYRGDRLRQYKRWRPVENKVADWRRAYERLHPSESDTPAVYLRDGGDFAIIVQHRENGLPRKHRLTGPSRAIYQFCQRPRTMGRLRAAFETVAEAELRSFLKMMVAKGLMFAEGERYLSLAAPLSWRRLLWHAESGVL
jgi:hypothetical protein